MHTYTHKHKQHGKLAYLWCIPIDKETPSYQRITNKLQWKDWCTKGGLCSLCLFVWNEVCYELAVCVSAFDLNVPHDALSSFSGICLKMSSQFKLASRERCLLLGRIHREKRAVLYAESDGGMGETTSKLPMPFSPIFDDAVLPQAFVSGLGHSCQTRCYPRSPPKNLRPRAAAPQTLNRSIRHTMLRAAGVWAVAVGACLVPWPETCALSQTHTHSCTPHCKSYALLHTVCKTIDLFFCVKCPIVLSLTSVLSVAGWPHSLLLVPPPPPSHRSAPWKYPQGLSTHM